MLLVTKVTRSLISIISTNVKLIYKHELANMASSAILIFFK
ncbi:hypothetical protein PSOS111911_04035 [Pseudoalteromonas ostreae]